LFDQVGDMLKPLDLSIDSTPARHLNQPVTNIVVRTKEDLEHVLKFFRELQMYRFVSLSTTTPYVCIRSSDM
jgi:hypothetical protein